jgi:hypothetical protein
MPSKKLTGIILGVFMSVLFPKVVVLAGSLEPSVGPAAAGSQMFTLDQIYNRINNGTAATKMTTFTGPTSGPTAGTMHTLDDLYTLVGLRSPIQRTGQTACYDSIGAVLPCPGTGQDGQFTAGVTWPNPRFTDNGNGAVTDNLTGLIWLRDANCTSFYSGDATGVNNRPWVNALTTANALAGGQCGLTDGSVTGHWCLPNVKELQSLIDYAYTSPALSNPAGTGQWAGGDPFIGIQFLNKYWSSTSYFGAPRYAWYVYLDNGRVVEDTKTTPYYVWPVRGGVMIMRGLWVRLLFTLALMLALPASPVQAGGTVTNCTDDTQFSSLLAGGGVVTFNCGTALINLSSTQTIPPAAKTTIDGGGKITLSGQNARQLFAVGTGASLTLRNIVLANGFSGGDGGAIFNGFNAGDGGVLILENSAIRDSKASLSGGAIVSTGPLTITNCLFEGNRALNGGALYPKFPSAPTTIVNSVLRDNHATDITTNGWGGAILAFGGAPVTIERSDISTNSAQDGGGIYIFPASSVTLNGSTLHDNKASGNGGGVYALNGGTATLTNVTLSGNRGNSGGGFYSYDSTATLTNVTLSGNSAISSGGGLHTDRGTATLTNATFNGNSAGEGGGISNYNGTATLTNVTLSGNSANDGGGLYNFNGTATLVNVTMSGNSAISSGGGIYQLGVVKILALKNSIVANSPTGRNCFQKYPDSPITSNGFNLSSDTSCAKFLNLPSDRNNQDPLLGPLADNGGPTLTHMPQPNPLPGSPAIDQGSGCPPTDQRGATRPVGPACDIGAVEYGALLPRLYLPLISNR